MNNIKIILVCLISIVLGCIAGSIFTCSNSGRNTESIKVLHDTLVITKPSEPVIIEKAKAKVIRIHDTLIQANPFIAKIDTIIHYDTISAEYEFPSNYFSIAVRKKPDSLKLIYITSEKYLEEKQPWWEKTLLIGGSAALGFLVGRATK